METMKESSIHGLSNTFRANRIVSKIMWILLLLASISFCVFFIFQSFSQFFEFNVITKIRETNEAAVLFPVITICNKNSYSTPESLEFLKNVGDKNNFSMLAENLNLTEKQMDQRRKTIKELASGEIIGGNYSDDMKKTLSMSLDDMLFSCRNFNKDCSATDFEWIFHLAFGNCYRFNSGTDANRTKTSYAYINQIGPENKLQLYLYLGGMPNELNKLFFYGKGVYLFINNQNENVYYQIRQPIELSTGIKIKILTHRTNYNFYPSPYSNCSLTENNINDSDSFYVKKLQSLNFKYTVDSCLELCFFDQVSKNCSCNHPYDMFGNKSMPICKTDQQLACLYASNKRTNIIGNYCSLRKICPIECVQNTFDYSMTYNSIDSSYVDILKQDPNMRKKFSNQTDFEQNLANNILLIEMNIKSLSYTRFDETPSFSEVDLLSSIGGTIGLFLGMSLLSIFEIFDVFIELLIKNAKRCISK